MSIQRRSLFGIPPRPVAGSTNTWRGVPLTQGLEPDAAWPAVPAGSSASLVNLLPIDGVLTPRSRLSSINTISAFTEGNASIVGMAKLTRADFGTTTIWVSAATRHGLVMSTGSISQASFVSAFGLGNASINNETRWQYAQTFMGTLGSTGENVLLATGRFSANTIFAIYNALGASSGVPQYSYLTGAPQCMSVGVWNNYVLAFNTREGNVPFASRVRWSVRGNPSNWTSEGAGFEDLLEMRGSGSAVIPTADGFVLLFTDLETWYGTPATYPAQFTFQALDKEMGCPAPETIQQTDRGIVFMGTDRALRLLPAGGGKSQVLIPALSKQFLRYNTSINLPPSSWGVYDPLTKIYHLFVQQLAASTFRAFAVNMATLEWGEVEYNTAPPIAGVAGYWNSNAWPAIEGLFFVNSNGTVFSTHSLKGTENGSAVTGTWRSGVLASDLAGNYKQLTKVCTDYRATSKSTVTLKISQDGGNTFDSGRAMALPVAPYSGRVETDVYAGGAFPTIELTSQSTGFELHRLDVSMNIGGRR